MRAKDKKVSLILQLYQRMELNLFLVLMLYWNLHIIYSNTFCVKVPEQNIAVLKCGKLTKGAVTWSRNVDGDRVDILTTREGKVIKHIRDPQRRYSSGASLILIISKVSLSDAGRYYCSGNTVELDVIAKSCVPVCTTPLATPTPTEATRTTDTCGASACETLLMMAGVAVVLLVLAAVAASRLIHHWAWEAGWTAGRASARLGLD